jgi:type II restriction enzyme
MTGSLADRFKSGSQKAGNVTEAWGAENFYCPNCSSPKLDWLKPGTKASDYKCPACGFWYQLKSKKSPIGRSIRDGAYAAMMEAIREDRAPSYFFLHYEIRSSRREEAQTSPQEFQMEPPDVGCYGSGGEGAIWLVRNLLLVPYFAFPLSAIIKCPPLSPTARRAGWVGCNFDLHRIPADARIAVVRTIASPRRRSGVAPDSDLKDEYGDRRDACPTLIVPPAEVREKFRRVKPLKEISVKERGWTLDVLNGVRSLGKQEFTNGDAYTLAEHLEQLHPDNRHVRDKIRQQLQVLRDAKLLIHVNSGLWRLS